MRTQRSCFTLIAGALLSSSCAVHWRGSDGVDRHLGLVAHQSRPLRQGSHATTLSLGLDVRLSAPDRGVSFGFRRQELMTPEVILVEDTDALPDLVHAHFEAGPGREAGPAPRWSFLYGTNPDGPEATQIRTEALGLDLRLGPVRSGLSALYHRSATLFGRALEPGVVQLYTPALSPDQHEELTLWQLVEFGASMEAPSNGEESSP